MPRSRVLPVTEGSVPGATATVEWQIGLRVVPGTDPIERILGVLRVRAPRYHRLEYTTSSADQPGSVSLELAATSETIGRLQRYLDRVIGVSEVTVSRLS
jgi:acetolactate synthase regulatory subunit